MFTRRHFKSFDFTCLRSRRELALQSSRCDSSSPEQERRRTLHVGVIEAPSALWTGQQLVNAFPYGSAPKYLIRDRDKVCGGEFVRRGQLSEERQRFSTIVGASNQTTAICASVQVCYPPRPTPQRAPMWKRQPLPSSSAFLWVLACVVALLAQLGCKRGSPADERQELIVFAASSLTEAFANLERAFEAENQNVDVSIAFAGSQVFRLQIEQGAPTDVFASANPDHMDALIRQGLVLRSETFAHNELVVVVPLDNPAGIESFEDLRKAKRLVIGVSNVPIGAYTREVLKRASRALGPDFETDVLEHVVSEESNVRLVRAKVELGEADAAIVYRTDAIPSDRVRSIPIPPDLNVRATYRVGVLQRAPHRALAERWVAFLLSGAGKRILADHGFVPE
ncbi:MAG: molybdate ABC transporter substrate-binding protein [Polyangiales bacterium]